ncbi:M14 metallopeptidase family protein [Flavobacterium sp.]|uniref:M14 family metallopeptidase n=1 Tax=Flavobacterium sp. TaxID=239 RepID=UPI0035B3CB1C
MDYKSLHELFREETITDKYITLSHIGKLIANNKSSVVGHSVENKIIYKIEIGNGKTKVFMWSQMHGNESTTTKALFDFINFLNSDESLALEFKEYFTFCMLPMVNPDGAEKYTRENANGVDLNRDSQALTQPESNVLRKVFEDFKPDYCYNLHDQRTIFGAGDKGNPATVSFLAPAYNENRDYNTTRLKAVEIIVAMNDVLQLYIPNQVGRFDDSFNINCIGDTFQNLGVPTILFEAGFYPNDYVREITRKYIFISLISGLKHIYENDIVSNKIEDYLNIPQNKVNFFDIVYKNVKINYDNLEKSINFAAQYIEKPNDGKIDFEAVIAQVDNLDNYFAHHSIDAQGKTFKSSQGSIPNIGDKANFYLGNDIEIVNGLIKTQ